MDPREAESATVKDGLTSGGSVRPGDVEGRRYGRKLAGLFVVGAVILSVLEWLYVARLREEARAGAQQELSGIADLKLNQLINWRLERLSDARLFSGARFAAQDVKRLLAEPDSEAARAAVSQWLNLLKEHERYDGAVVFDLRLEPRLALPPSASEPAAFLRTLLEPVLRTHDVVWSDLHRNEPNDPIELDLLLPIFDDADLTRRAPIAVVLLKLDARRFLFPLIQSWPTASHTAETLLVRREGDEVLYLNDLRHRPGTALSLRLPLSSVDLPAARIARGDTNVVEGADYRGVPVVAIGRFVPGTSWAMVTKVDREEIYAPLRRRTLSALAVLGALLTSGALLMGLLWRNCNAELLELALAEREAHEQERQRMNCLYAALSQINGAVVRSRSPEELLQAMCRVMVRYGGAQMAWVGWVDRATMRVQPLAQQGDQGGYLEQIQVFADQRPEGQGPVGTAIREGHPCVCANIAEDPRMVPWREAAARSGWRSLAAFPIRQEDEIRGALAVYAGQSNFFGPREQALLEEAAADASFGLDVLLNEQRRKQAEDQLARANAVLEDNVRERTVQLIDANANLQTFAHTSAHDLRSPLRAIRSISGLILEDCGPALGEDGRSMLARVIASADQMGQLLDDLLEYSRMNQAQVQLEPVELGKAVNEALVLLDGDIRAKNAIVSVAESLPAVTGHLATLVVAINNLVSNALKFMPSGVQPQVRISAEQTKNSVRLWVEDNGIGIDPANHEKIFGAFERLHSRRQYPGSGLGLAIVRKAAERMGGRVGVESEPGKGSRFWVELKTAEHHEFRT